MTPITGAGEGFEFTLEDLTPIDIGGEPLPPYSALELGTFPQDTGVQTEHSTSLSYSADTT